MEPDEIDRNKLIDDYEFMNVWLYCLYQKTHANFSLLENINFKLSDHDVLVMNAIQSYIGYDFDFDKMHNEDIFRLVEYMVTLKNEMETINFFVRAKSTLHLYFLNGTIDCTPLFIKKRIMKDENLYKVFNDYFRLGQIMPKENDLYVEHMELTRIPIKVRFKV